jgi:hypothetical protein
MELPGLQKGKIEDLQIEDGHLARTSGWSTGEDEVVYWVNTDSWRICKVKCNYQVLLSFCWIMIIIDNHCCPHIYIYILLYYIILYYIVLYCIVLYYIISYYIILYIIYIHSILDRIIPWNHQQSFPFRSIPLKKLPRWHPRRRGIGRGARAAWDDA